MIPANLTEAQWASLTEHEQEQLLSDLEDLVGGESLREFMTRMAPHHPPPPHLDELIELIEEARVNRLMKVGISLPPGHAKTTLFVNAFAWWLTKFPADTCAYNSYNAAMAFSKSVLARSLAERAGVQLSEDTNNKAEWRTTAGGGLLAGGLESLTGKRVQGPLVIDDPYSGHVDASSPAYREEAWNAMMSVAMTRREGAPLFLVHTRWNEDDSIGRVKKLKLKGWRIVNLPAISETGKALWSAMYSAADLRAIRDDVGEYVFAALYQGEPRPRGGAVFGEPHYYDPKAFDMTGWRLVLAGDPAASTRTSADYSAAGVIAVRGEGPTREGRVLYAYRKQVPIPQFANDLLAMQHRFGETAINIEAVGGFKAIPQMLKAIHPDLRINEITPVGDKFTRAQPAAAAWNTGRLLVPADSPPWLGPFLDEVTKFTGVNDKNDDQVDWLAHAWNTETGPSMFDLL
jgi:predicted phage terminase large subunit-like protein